MNKTYIQDFTEYKETKTQSLIDDRETQGLTTSDWTISVKLIESRDKWLDVLFPTLKV